MASRAPFREATGPSLAVAFGWASRPVHWSFPLGETYKVTEAAQVGATHIQPTRNAGKRDGKEIVQGITQFVFIGPTPRCPRLRCLRFERLGLFAARARLEA
jgi:hypothetical protein